MSLAIGGGLAGGGGIVVCSSLVADSFFSGLEKQHISLCLFSSVQQELLVLLHTQGGDINRLLHLLTDVFLQGRNLVFGYFLGMQPV